eukprot:2058914-Lingulodinium_polyedra.AAC.1
MVVEQAHGSCAVFHRLHPMYGVTMVGQRAMLRQCRHLFNLSVEDKTLLKLQKRAAQLEGRDPRK